MNKILRTLLSEVPAFAAALPLAPAADAAVKTGTLTCQVAGGIGLIFGSRRSVDCEFGSRRSVERYTGRIDRIGADIGFSRNTVIVWSVVESTRRHGDLSGRYTGATAQATIGVGLGANVLVGGGHDSIALQPFSVGTQTGLNIAAASGSLH